MQEILVDPAQSPELEQTLELVPSHTPAALLQTEELVMFSTPRTFAKTLYSPLNWKFLPSCSLEVNLFKGFLINKIGFNC